MVSLFQASAKQHIYVYKYIYEFPFCAPRADLLFRQPRLAAVSFDVCEPPHFDLEVGITVCVACSVCACCRAQAGRAARAACTLGQAWLTALQRLQATLVKPGMRCSPKHGRPCCPSEFLQASCLDADIVVNLEPRSCSPQPRPTQLCCCLRIVLACERAAFSSVLGPSGAWV